ncbi:MAG: diguanylate cyclase [Sterolibacterium sp.]
MRILFADDSKATAAPTIEFLRQRGYRVTYVLDGRAAVEAYQAETPDLVLMDVVMPEMDGIEATRRIKALGGARWIPVMLMTGLTSKEEIVAGLDAGADDYLTKPIVLEVLEARVRSMQRIATIQDSLFGVLDNVYEAILTIDEAGIVKSYNLAAERIFGHTAAEVVGRNVKCLMPSPYADEHDGYLARYVKERTPHVIGIGRKVCGLRKNGDIFPMRLAVTEVRLNKSSQFIGLISDISEEELARQRIEFLALHDPLTTLPNRAHFNDALDAMLKKTDGSMHAVLFIDLDGFKPINDTLGHEAGDEALKAVASRLRHNTASGDFVARLGGDEFVAIAHGIADPDAGLTIANRLLEAISQPLTLLGTPCRMGASIGVAIAPQHGTTANDILTAADDAMYAAKRGGKNRCILGSTSRAMS